MLVVSKTICDFMFKISNHNYPGINVHDASNAFLLPLHFHVHDKHGILTNASEVANNLRIELIGLNYLWKHAFLGSKCLYRLNQRRRTPIVIHWRALTLVKKKIQICNQSWSQNMAIWLHFLSPFGQPSFSSNLGFYNNKMFGGKM